MSEEKQIASASLDAALGGCPFYSTETGAIYVPLPRTVWRSAGRCDCHFCKGSEGFWDTLVIPGRNDRQAYTFTVHFPELFLGQTPAWLQRGRRDYV